MKKRPAEVIHEFWEQATEEAKGVRYQQVYQWFEANLVVGHPKHPQLNAEGVSFPGAAFIGIGYSDDVGWTHTNNTIKNADFTCSICCKVSGASSSCPALTLVRTM